MTVPRNRETPAESGKCWWCDADTGHPEADACDKHGLTNEQLAQMMDRVNRARHEFFVELWGARSVGGNTP